MKHVAPGGSAQFENTLKVSVWRSDTDGYQTFLVPQQDSQTVLDIVTWIQQNDDPTLSYRFACRVGMCGSCAMMVNGEPRWTCRTHVSKVTQNGGLEIAPLRNLPVIKDLVVDMDPFFDKWVAAEGVFEPSLTRNDPIEVADPTTVQRQQADAAIECINCAVCYAACDSVAADPDYLGPAALNRAWSLVNDVRDAGGGPRLDAISGAGGCQNCHSMGSCAQYCPNDLNPTASIAGLKWETAKSWMKQGWLKW